jgi:hypothetical protein
MYYNLCHGTLELVEIWYLDHLEVSLSICMVRFSEKTLDLVNQETSHQIWGKELFLKHSSDLGQRE